MNKAKKFSFISLALTVALCFFALAITAVKGASAEGQASSFAMSNGAEVRVVDGEEAGIRWTATVNKAFYDSLNVAEGAEVRFGAVVTAKKLLGESELTKDSEKAQIVLCAATAPAFDENGDFSFHASIVYDGMNEWTEADRNAAYATELVARAFIKVGENYTYVSAYPSARSMRAVALTAVRAGNDAELLSKYYGGNYTTADKGYYGINDTVSEFALPEEGSVSVYYGAEPVTAEVADGKIKVSGIENLEAQSEYSLNIFVGNNAFVQPFVAATKVIRKAEDLSFFALEDITKVQGVSIKSTTIFDGYYVVANDIDATGYEHQAVKDSNYNAILNSQLNSAGEVVLDNNGRAVIDSAYYHKGEVRTISDMAIYGGLTGTFDGAGHTISNLSVIDQGIFGLMANGTVKNVAFTGVTMKGSGYKKNICLFAQNVVKGTFENVYVKANPLYGGDELKEQSSDARGNRSLIATQVGGYYNLITGTKPGWYTTNFINCVFDYEIKNTKIQYCFSYGLYTQEAAYYKGADSAVSPNFNNVYVISNATICVMNNSLIAKKENTHVILAENDVAEGQTVLEAAIGLMEGCFFNSDETENTLNESFVKVAGRLKADETGVKRYITSEAMNQAGNDYSSFNTAYWSVVNGVLGWKA